MSRKAEGEKKRSENQINRVYYVIVFPSQDIYSKGHVRKKVFSSFFLCFILLLSPFSDQSNRSKIISLIFFLAHNSEGNLHKSVITYNRPEWAEAVN